MKNHCTAIVIFLVLTNFSKAVQSEIYDVNVTETEELLKEEVSRKNLPTIKNLCTLYDQLELINDFPKQKYKKLFIIIADVMADAITLAEFLSGNNRLLPERNNSLYNDLVENYYLYYSMETSAHIFVYPKKMENEILATYLTKRTIENAERIKIALTCNEDNNNDTLHRMFQTAAKILSKTDLKQNPNFTESIIFSPLSAKEKCGYLKAVNKLEEYFYKKFSRFKTIDGGNLFSNLYSNLKNLSIQETIEYHVIEPILTMKLVFGIDDLCQIDQVFSHLLRILVWNYIETNLIVFNHSLPIYETNETLKCFESKILTMENVLSNDLHFDMSTLTGVFDFFNFLQSNNDKLSFLQYDEKSLDDLCNCGEKLEIVKLFCHVRYMLNAPSYNWTIWINCLQRFAEDHLVKKVEWYRKLKSLYDDHYLWNEVDISREFQNLYEEIFQIGQSNQNFLKNAFFTIKNNTVNMQVNVSCSPLKNTNIFYKLQFKGKFLKISQILNNDNYCQGRVKFIEIFALEKIIIDQDLIEFGQEEEIQLNIFAPIWEIVFDRVINLDGVSGNDWKSVKADDTPKDAVLGKNNGPPGLPGRPGGIFFGIYEKLIRGEKLFISSNGGNGGDGKNGGKGNGPLNPPGDGGTSGEGGYHGLVELLSIGNDSILSTQISVANGVNGDYGIGAIFLNNDHLLIGKSNHNKEGYQRPIKPTVLEDFSEAIKSYRKYLISSALNNNNDNNNNALDLYEKLNNKANILSKYKILDFIQDLTYLEKCYSMNMKKSTSLRLLIAWRHGIYEYFKNTQNENNTQRKEYSRVLLILDTIVSRKIQKLKERFYDHSILKIDLYLEECLAESLRLRDGNILLEMRTISGKFKIDFEKEIKIARKLIQADVQQYLDERINELSGKIRQLVVEVDTIRKEKETEIEKLQQKRVDLKNKLMLRSFFGTVQFLFLALSFINPVCAVVGSLLRVGAHVLETETLDSDDDSNFMKIRLPKGVINSLERTFHKYDQKNETLIEKIYQIEEKKQITNRTFAQPLIPNFPTLKSTIFPSRHSRNILPENIDIDSEAIVELGKETYEKISKNLAKLRNDDPIIQQQNDIEKLEDFKRKIFQHLTPTIQQIRERIQMKTSEFVLSSITIIEFEKWRMDEYLVDVGSKLESWMEKFKIEESVKVVMRKMKNAIKTISRLHQLIREFHAKIKNAEHVENIASAPFQITDVQNPNIRKPLTKLMHTHYANDILDEYKKWIIAFKQYTFPFGEEFTDISESPLAIFNDPLEKANLVVEKMKFLKSHLNKRKAHGQLFKYTSTVQFGNGGPLSSFNTWRNRSDVKNILQGHEVNLFGNIGWNNLNAVKFRNVNIKFVSNSSEINDSIENDLKGFRLTLTHNGDSYYRCDDQIYLIETGAFEFGSKFFHQSRRRRRSLDQLDYVLSPFATWTLRLNSISGSNDDFTILSKYINSVNIEMIGEGQYITSNIVCRNDLTNYYGKKI